MPKEKKILITGSNGLLGQNLIFALKNDFSITAIDTAESSFVNPAFIERYVSLDLTDHNSIKAELEDSCFDIIINTAAMTNVDLCETEKIKAKKINYYAVINLLNIFPDSKFVQISTDYVFDGKSGPYSEYSKTNPVSIYGFTKLDAEKKILEKTKNLVVRIMVLFGNGSKIRPNFISWIISSLTNNKKIRVVDDQIGNLTLASNLAFNIKVLLKKNISGIMHLSGKEILSRYDIAIKTAEYFGLKKDLISPCKTNDFNQKAKRPLRSGFTLERARDLEGIRLLDFNSQIERYSNESKNINYNTDL